MAVSVYVQANILIIILWIYTCMLENKVSRYLQIFFYLFLSCQNMSMTKSQAFMTTVDMWAVPLLVGCWLGENTCWREPLTRWWLTPARSCRETNSMWLSWERKGKTSTDVTVGSDAVQDVKLRLQASEDKIFTEFTLTDEHTRYNWLTVAPLSSRAFSPLYAHSDLQNAINYSISHLSLTNE